MLLRAQSGNYILNMDKIEALKIGAPESGGPVYLEAHTGGGNYYGIARVSSTPEARAVLSDFSRAANAGAEFFDFKAYHTPEESARDMERDLAKANNGAALDWTDTRIEADSPEIKKHVKTDHNQPSGFNWEEVMEVNAMDPEEFSRRENEITKRIAAGTDIIQCDYPADARAVILGQDGQAIENPATWDGIYMKVSGVTDMGGGVAIKLETYDKETRATAAHCLGVYPTMEAPRIFRELRDKIENEAELIKMP